MSGPKDPRLIQILPLGQPLNLRVEYNLTNFSSIFHLKFNKGLNGVSIEIPTEMEVAPRYNLLLYCLQCVHRLHLHRLHFAYTV